MPDLKAPPLATGATAEVFAWQDGQVLKLFRRSATFVSRVEQAAVRIASACGLRVPAVIDVVEVDGRKGIVFERVEGPTMSEYLRQHPDAAVECAEQMATLHAEIHQRETSGHWGLFRYGFILALYILLSKALPLRSRLAVLWLLIRLPNGKALCHGDFHAANIILSPDGPVVIDWADAARGNPMADHARTWIISRNSLAALEQDKADAAPMQAFFQTYFHRYCQLRPCPNEELVQWRIVAATVSLALEGVRNVATSQRVAFVKAALEGAEHPWLSR